MCFNLISSLLSLSSSSLDERVTIIACCLPLCLCSLLSDEDDDDEDKEDEEDEEYDNRGEGVVVGLRRC